MDKELTVYEPPMLAEAGDFTDVTHGIRCKCADSLSNNWYSAADEIEWLWGPVAF
jgi:hypothetical protein